VNHSFSVSVSRISSAAPTPAGANVTEATLQYQSVPTWADTALRHGQSLPSELRTCPPVQ